MKKLDDGVYVDDEGVLHLDLPELCIANGFLPTQENQDRLEATAMELLAAMAGQMGRAVVNVDVHLDVLPAGCSLQQEGPVVDPDGVPQVRFRARTEDARLSRWLPWQPIWPKATTVIRLRWSGFWRDEE